MNTKTLVNLTYKCNTSVLFRVSLKTRQNSIIIPIL
ncbi:hypothetical protein BAZSYMB_SCAFFOLD00002_93 [Bathymodiolus azoricus thioautotrophic gill symbiont]|uniref:Uncharacterized protein n=1 Tax=Bathymodiolus azoricus thioautotrophic gill symbiont TaxID=235205 RepID=A0A1H6LAT3_9GAMM|nr:hypothetical protein BAZSYMA_ACONTIG157753_1 [Bathymodiolus azoricus thioautotrophic gill symbiont]SEH83266.1 hypothetical protein BAZSYMB_SCAFFOLD00002_93 [Bathymodiolus azoricus thioautotrophic gill symbiont]